MLKSTPTCPLPDIREARIDPTLPVNERLRLFAAAIGTPVLRLKSDYLAIATLGFAEILRAVIQWEKLGPLTNASNILRKFTGYNSILFPFIVSGICIAIIVLLINSTYGRAFKAIRDDEVAAEAMGINLARHKRLAFCISSFFAGVGGGPLERGIPAVVARHNARGHIAKHGADRARQRGGVHKARAALLPDGPRQAVGQNEAALGVCIEYLDGLAGQRADQVPRQQARRGDAVLAARHDGRNIHRNPGRRNGAHPPYRP